MKIIDAFWEKRNLGVDCKEIIIEKSDKIVDIQKIKYLLQPNQYIVVKVPIGCFEINNFLSELGFTFIECSLNVFLQLKNVKLNSLQIRLNNEIQYSEMDDNDFKQLTVELKKNMFETDRVLLDPNFTLNQSSQRYINWIRDELKKDAQLYKITFKNNTIGFFAFKMKSKDVYYPFLAGLYGDFANSGLGFSTIYKPIEEAKKRGGSSISTYISSNNSSIFRAHIQLGFTINETLYTFVKHVK